MIYLCLIPMAFAVYKAGQWFDAAERDWEAR